MEPTALSDRISSIDMQLRASELLDGFGNVLDTIWIITPSEDRVEILRDSMTPEREGDCRLYSQLCAEYMQNYLYPPDLDWWDEVLSPKALEKMLASKTTKLDFDMRFRNEQFGFEWHEAHLSVLGSDTARRVLLTSRYVNSDRRAAIVERAVRTEYDYVVYIEADKNSYVMYSSNDETGTPLPPVASDNYEKEVAQFHRLYVPLEEQATLTWELSIANAGEHLRASGEYVTYCTVIENNARRDKKLRFSYFDREKNIWLLTRTDITQVRQEMRQKKELQDALETAMVASQAKSNFLSRMSHDIRTPMNAIMGMTSIAKSHLDNRERVADCLEKINISSTLLLSLINEVLDMSKIESGHIVLAEEEVDLAVLVNGIVTMLQPQMDAKNQQFEAHVHDVIHENVISDRQRLQQLLLNLLSNAVKYTPEGGSIYLEICEKPSPHAGKGCYEFVVADNGSGMEPAFLQRVFEPFERAEDERIQRVQGTGLGLAICKSIVEQMGGTIRAQSKFRKGSRFSATVSLQLRGDPIDAHALFGKKVLIVDDDEIICRNTSERLHDLGIQADCVLCGTQAIDQALAAHAAGEDYFALIIDRKMPEMDGIETTRKIREELGRRIPVIMIFSYDFSEYYDAAKQAGADDFIMKPLFRSRLIYKLKQCLNSGCEPAPAQAGQNKAERSFTGKRILLCEDNMLNREIAVELLSVTGAMVETAEDGKIALHMVTASPEGYYDLIFMDMQMPVMDGCASTAAIRALPREDTKRMPIIAMTANAFADDREKTKKAGMNEHLAKPVDMAKLLKTLQRWLLIEQ